MITLTVLGIIFSMIASVATFVFAIAGAIIYFGICGIGLIFGVKPKMPSTNSVSEVRKKSFFEEMSEPPYSYGAINTIEDFVEDEDYKHYLISRILMK